MKIFLQQTFFLTQIYSTRAAIKFHTKKTPHYNDYISTKKILTHIYKPENA